MLTPRQLETLLFIDAFIKREGFAPSFMEIADGIGVKSKGQINFMLNHLEAHGFIKRAPATSRSIIVRKVPVTGTEARIDEMIKKIDALLHTINTKDAPITTAKEMRGVIEKAHAIVHDLATLRLRA